MALTLKNRPVPDSTYTSSYGSEFFILSENQTYPVKWQLI